MAKITNTEHEAIFALGTPADDGAEDGVGAVMVSDLGEKSCPSLGNSMCSYGRR